MSKRTANRPKPKAATRDHMKKKRKPFNDVFIVLDPEAEASTNKLEAEVDRIESVMESVKRRIEVSEKVAEKADGIEKIRAEAEADVDRKKLADLEVEHEDAEKAFFKSYDAQVKATVKVRVESIGRKAYDALVEEHPPTDEQTAEWQKDNPKEDGSPGDTIPDYNGDTFPPALIGACLVGELKGLTGEEVDAWTAEWNFAEFMQLFTAAIAVNSASRVQPWGKDYG